MNDAYAAARAKMLAAIARQAAETAALTGLSKFSDRVLVAMERVPRHAFVPDSEKAFAYLNQPLPIGHGQTISQPFIVACMTALLDIGPGDRVLEIGTGCGYQTAILAELAAAVYSVEVVAELAESARRRLQGLAYDNVIVRHGDGFLGWPEYAPFDGIIVTAAPRTVPTNLTAQLAIGGRMVVPIGLTGDSQWLKVGTLGVDGGLKIRDVMPVAFVPMVQGNLGPST